MLQELYPRPPRQVPLEGLYLAAPLRPPGHGGLFCYTNFITSLDGRIALADRGGAPRVPETTANARDWRLFQELAARADVLITSGAYLRQYAAGTAQSPLPVSLKPAFDALRRWRREQGLPAQPDVAVVSAGLEFLVPAGFAAQGRRVLVFTPQDAPRDRAAALQAQGAEVLPCGTREVDGGQLARQLAARGYGNAYSVAGPLTTRTLLAAGALDSLFLTLAPRLLGGTGYSTLLEGPALDPPARCTLRWLYHDGPGGGQLFARYDVQRTGAD